jgi:hypothetical protein
MAPVQPKATITASYVKVRHAVSTSWRRGLAEDSSWPHFVQRREALKGRAVTCEEDQDRAKMKCHEIRLDIGCRPADRCGWPVWAR